MMNLQRKKCAGAGLHMIRAQNLESSMNMRFMNLQDAMMIVQRRLLGVWR